MKLVICDDDDDNDDNGNDCKWAGHPGVVSCQLWKDLSSLNIWSAPEKSSPLTNGQIQWCTQRNPLLTNEQIWCTGKSCPNKWTNSIINRNLTSGAFLLCPSRRNTKGALEKYSWPHLRNTKSREIQKFHQEVEKISPRNPKNFTQKSKKFTQKSPNFISL